MRRRTCDTCEGGGEVLTMVPGHTGEPVEGTVDCPDCMGEGSYADPSILDRTIGGRRADQLRGVRRRGRRQLEHAQQMWRDRDAQTVAAWKAAHRNVLDDEPRLRTLINSDLKYQLEQLTPLGWRRADLRWALENARRAVRGQQMLPLPYEDVVNVMVTDQPSALTDSDYFIRNQVAIVAERRRRPVLPAGMRRADREPFPSFALKADR